MVNGIADNLYCNMIFSARWSGSCLANTAMILICLITLLHKRKLEILNKGSGNIII